MACNTPDKMAPPPPPRGDDPEALERWARQNRERRGADLEGPGGYRRQDALPYLSEVIPGRMARPHHYEIRSPKSEVRSAQD